MDKIKVIDRKKYNDLSIYFSFFKFEDLHVSLINLLTKLGIDENSLNEIDIVFDKINEDFYYFFNEKYKVCIFITLDKVHLFIQSINQNYKKELIKLIRNTFKY
jgi:hypothetical protein